MRDRGDWSDRASGGLHARRGRLGGTGRVARWRAGPGMAADDVQALAVDREDRRAFDEAPGDGCDVLLDCVAYGQGHAQQLLGAAGRVGSAVVISSVGVDEDEHGRSFDTQDEPAASRNCRYRSPRPSGPSHPARPPTRRGRLHRSGLSSEANCP